MRPIAFAPLLALAFFLSGPIAAGHAAERRAYTPAALQQAETAGKPVVVHVTAPWCQTCAAQIPVVMTLLKEPKYKDLTLLTVDFDKQKGALRQLKVQAQSTFVAFKGTKEVGRSTGETDAASIENLFDRTN